MKYVLITNADVKFPLTVRWESTNEISFFTPSGYPFVLNKKSHNVYSNARLQQGYKIEREDDKNEQLT